MKKDKRRKSKNGTSIVIVSSLAYLVIGFFMILSPETVNNTLCYILGIALTVYGLFNIISYFFKKEQNLYVELVIGVIATAFGIFTLFSPDVIIRIIPVALGIIIVIDSLINIKQSIQLKTLGMKKWWIFLAVSIAVVILGFSIIFFSDIFGKFLIMLLGIVMVYKGISGFSVIGLFGYYAKKVDNYDKMIEAEATDLE